ncbi:hypothetical protein Rsub_10638 [Raphidocelis subcapitata]|uniref:C2 NT-type domain-containing protein n=1 Tax=Raphidocelis subcapitata TaxID=307507 RepID=A0A2V0PLQ6_9CHLO|nr:hypothetical protein Rsub_10638 [Raphidocelis subcapitata]|eukprot:GBF97965.1 hypothetical protein Rsub_10638 [Raphidocelis subcapitata]
MSPMPGARGTRYYFELLPHAVEGVPEGVRQVSVVMERGAKLAYTEPARVDAATGRAMLHVIIRRSATIYQSAWGGITPKEFKMKVQSLETSRRGDTLRRTIARANLDLARFAPRGAAPETHPVDLRLDGAGGGVVLRMTVRAARATGGPLGALQGHLGAGGPAEAATSSLSGAPSSLGDASSDRGGDHRGPPGAGALPLERSRSAGAGGGGPTPAEAELLARAVSGGPRSGGGGGGGGGGDDEGDYHGKAAYMDVLLGITPIPESPNAEGRGSRGGGSHPGSHPGSRGGSRAVSFSGVGSSGIGIGGAAAAGPSASAAAAAAEAEAADAGDRALLRARSAPAMRAPLERGASRSFVGSLFSSFGGGAAATAAAAAAATADDDERPPSPSPPPPPAPEPPRPTLNGPAAAQNGVGRRFFGLMEIEPSGNGAADTAAAQRPRSASPEDEAAPAVAAASVSPPASVSASAADRPSTAESPPAPPEAQLVTAPTVVAAPAPAPSSKSKKGKKKKGAAVIVEQPSPPAAPVAPVRGGSADSPGGPATPDAPAPLDLDRASSGPLPSWMWPQGREAVRGASSDALSKVIADAVEVEPLQDIARGLLAERNDWRAAADAARHEARDAEATADEARAAARDMAETVAGLQVEVQGLKEESLAGHLVEAQVKAAQMDLELGEARGALERERERARALTERVTKLEAEAESAAAAAEAARAEIAALKAAAAQRPASSGSGAPAPAPAPVASRLPWRNASPPPPQPEPQPEPPQRVSSPTADAGDASPLPPRGARAPPPGLRFGTRISAASGGGSPDGQAGDNYWSTSLVRSESQREARASALERRDSDPTDQREPRARDELMDGPPTFPSISERVASYLKAARGTAGYQA